VNKRPILKLNSGYFPVGIGNWTDIIVNIFSGAAHPLDIQYAQDDNGGFDLRTVEYLNLVRDWKDWSKLPIRDCDDYVHTTSGPVRLPSVVVCSRFHKVVFRQVQFPTKNNIFKRDKFTCGYTGKKLQKHELSIDHILPVSRGGKDTWENLITCDRTLNTEKGDRTPSEFGLKLLWTPEKPKNGLIFDALREDWNTFLGG